MSQLRKFISWLFLKLMFGAFVAVSAAALLALWRFDHDPGDTAAVRREYLADVGRRIVQARKASDQAAAALAKTRGELAAVENRADQAARIAASLEGLQSTWDRFFGNRAQWKINDRRIDALRAESRRAQREAKGLSSAVTRAGVILGRRQAELRSAEDEAADAGWSESPVYYYAFRSWWDGWWVFLSLACLYLIGPTLRKVGLYYQVAPRIARGRPLRLAPHPAPSPWLGSCRPCIEVALWPGERALVRRRYLDWTEEGLAVKPRLFLGWRFAATSLLSGLVHLVEVRSVRAGRDYRLSLAHHRHRENEMAVVHVPEGGSLVVRPSYLAGVVLPPGQRLRYRRRWQLFRWQSWVTAQLRYLEFVGPCRLVVAGRPGLWAERLETREDGGAPSCRVAQNKVIAFTPNLEYRLVRSVRFWNYYRWNARLFDALFTGVGFVLTQAPQPGRSRGVLAATRHQARRVFGL